jgi:hypothetical protein
MLARITVQFEDKYPYSCLHFARLYCDLQHIMAFALAFTEQERSLYRFDLMSPEKQKYEYMIMADLHQGTTDDLVFIESVQLNSPLRIRMLANFTGGFRSIASFIEVIKRIIMVDLYREKMIIENEQQRQLAISRALKNYEDILKISSKIRDPDRRALFERNLISAIAPFVDGRHPPVEKLGIAGPSE